MSDRSAALGAVLLAALLATACAEEAPTALQRPGGQPPQAPLVGASPTATGSPIRSSEAFDLLVNPVGFDFGEVQIGATAPLQVAHVTNIGLLPVELSGSGGAPGTSFNATQSCQGVTLQPGEACQISFSFTPEGAGPAAATSSGTWNGEPFSIDLAGVGVPPRFQLSPTGIDFGDVQLGQTASRVVDVTNVGLAEVVMDGAGGAPGGDFSGFQSCQGQTLAVGESCQLTFSFTPTSEGATTAVSSGTWNGQPYSIDLEGTGVAPRFQVNPLGMDFGEVEVGQTASRVVDVTNVGLAEVVVSGAGGAPGGDFNAFQNCQGRTLAVGESCQVTFSYAPTSPGPTSGISSGTWNGQPFSVELTGTGLATGASPALAILVPTTGLDFGSVQVGSTSAQRSVEVRNVSAAEVTLSGAGGAPGGDFNGFQNCQGRTLAPGEACEITFSFAPSAAGSATATSSGTWNGQPYAVELVGQGVPPSFRLSASALDFGFVQVGSPSATQEVEVLNVGLDAVVMSGAGGAPGGDFNAFQNCQGRTLAVGESCAVTFSFAPAAAGPSSAVSAGSWNGQPFEVELEGTGVGPKVLVTPTAFDFGPVPVGETSGPLSSKVINRGLAPLEMSGSGGAPGGQFGAFQSCQGVTIGIGDSCELSFTFSPTVLGLAQAVSSGAWNGDPFSVDLMGFGDAPFVLVEVDVTPGDDGNAVNTRGRGVVPVALLGTDDFDVSEVDPESVTFAGAPVRFRPNGSLAATLEDVNADGILDLLLHIDRASLNLDPGTNEVLLEGQTYGGLDIRGTAEVRTVP